MLTFLLYTLAAQPTPLLVEAKDILDGKLPATSRILDVRSLARYEQGHLPGARRIDLSKWSQALTDQKADADFWSQAFAAAKLDPDVMTPIVLSGDDMREVCRGWWLLRYAGVKDVRILNGNLRSFTDAGGKLSTETPNDPDMKAKVWKPSQSYHATREDLLKTVSARGVVIDARSPREFADGRVPGARHLEWVELLDDKTGKFKSIDELKKLFAVKGIDPGQSPTCYCASGGRASVVAFASELVSGKPAKNYYRSWTEWGFDPTTPKEK